MLIFKRGVERNKFEKRCYKRQKIFPWISCITNNVYMKKFTALNNNIYKNLIIFHMRSCDLAKKYVDVLLNSWAINYILKSLIINTSLYRI